MEPFMEMFFAIDKSQNEVITEDELTRYVEENNLDKGMIEQWKHLFDPDNTGRITLVKFCDVLGLKPEEARSLRVKVQAAIPNLHPDITVISTNMELNDQIKVSETARNLVKSWESFDAGDVSKQLKEWLDRNYEPKWQVIIVKGPYWMTYSYCPNSAFHFRLRDYTFLIWRTPDLEYIF